MITNDRREEFINALSKTDTKYLEALQAIPNGRAMFEASIIQSIDKMNITNEEKGEFILLFNSILNKMEERIKHQKQGEQILNQL
jgi:hypothetical protein